MNKSSAIACILIKCKFPITCNWNKKCIQKGLQESLETKSSTRPLVKVVKDQKTDRRIPGG